MKTRRQFMLETISGAISLGFAATATAAATAVATATAPATRIEENSPAAAALGYKHDGAKVDSKKYPTYAAGKNCANCVLFQGKASDAWAACGALGGKQVNAKGWCIAWAKKA